MAMCFQSNIFFIYFILSTVKEWQIFRAWCQNKAFSIAEFRSNLQCF